MSGAVEMAVRVRVSPVRIERWDVEQVLVGGYSEPDYQYRPNAVGAILTITLLFGDGPPSKAPRRSKTISGIARIKAEQPTEEEWNEATVRALNLLAEQVERHGLPAAGGER